MTMIESEIVTPRPLRPWYVAYAAAAVPLVLGVAIAVGGFWRLYTEVRDMQRVVVPGEADVVLGAGDHVVFAESHSVVDGVAIASGPMAGTCELADPSTHAPVALAATSATTTYSFGSYQGTSAFSFTAPHDGTYHLTCTSDGPRAVLAIGDGLGAGIALILVAGFGGGIGALVTALVIRRRRRRASAPVT